MNYNLLITLKRKIMAYMCKQKMQNWCNWMQLERVRVPTQRFFFVFLFFPLQDVGLMFMSHVHDFPCHNHEVTFELDEACQALMK